MEGGAKMHNIIEDWGFRVRFSEGKSGQNPKMHALPGGA